MWVRVTDAKKNNAGYFVIEIETEDAIFENGKRSDQELCGKSKFKKDENLLNQIV